MKGHIATIHEGKKQFKCNLCNTKFGEKSNLRRHIVTVHEGKKLFKCDICNAKFGGKSDLNKHVMTEIVQMWCL